MRILHISDTHGFHADLPMERFDGVDVVVHSGDCSNWMDPSMNFKEVFDFLEWYARVPVKHKVYVAGNHDTSIERRLVTRENFADRGITYLENEYAEIEGVRMFGSPTTPTFGNWAFMKSRDTIDRHWRKIDGPIDLFVTHGPPQGILDLSFNRANELEWCGCKALGKHIKRLRPKLVCFGHIHNCSRLENCGVLIRDGITYSNAAMVEDGRFDKGLVSHGNLLEI